jgi:hypothetical protein
MPDAREPAEVESYAGPVSPWPRPIPARISSDKHDELLVMTLGEVDTPLADGVFDPVADRITLKDGTVIGSYYKQTLGVPFYTPLDKTHFRLPPSGWCSWYYYYQEVSADEILANARWTAEHLKEYGARYVQIDDGWQGCGRGGGENRDWATVNERFHKLGMDGLAAEIRRLGLEPGIWLCPHGQSSKEVVKSSKAFLLKPDGTSASDTWQGNYLVDPTAPEGQAYLRDLFKMLRDWGYTYFKIDGQPFVLEEYAKTLEFVKAKPPRADSPEEHAALLYRQTLRTIREAIGDEAFLLGCFGIPLPGVGIMNGSRTAGDIMQGWEGFLIANDAVQRWSFLHNIAWYCDPDVCLVRPPLSGGTARAWATLQALSGQVLMASDRLPDLPPARVEMLKRVYPAVDVRPLDLFKPSHARKPIWLLKVAQQVRTRREYDIVAVFNYDADKVGTYYLSWPALGLDAQRQYHVYDFWQQTYLGAWENGIFIDVPPADVRVLTLVPAEELPVLVSTSRHITQGWVDVLELSSSGAKETPVLRGRSHVIGGDPYTLTIGLPRAAPTYRLAKAVGLGNERREVGARFQSHQGYATVVIDSDVTQEVSWKLEFAPARPYVFPVKAPDRALVEQQDMTQIAVTWPTGWDARAGYQVLLDGRAVGIAFQPRAVLRDLASGQAHVIGVRSVWYDGSASKETAETQYTPS